MQAILDKAPEKKKKILLSIVVLLWVCMLICTSTGGVGTSSVQDCSGPVWNKKSRADFFPVQLWS